MSHKPGTNQTCVNKKDLQGKAHRVTATQSCTAHDGQTYKGRERNQSKDSLISREDSDSSSAEVTETDESDFPSREEESEKEEEDEEEKEDEEESEYEDEDEEEEEEEEEEEQEDEGEDGDRDEQSDRQGGRNPVDRRISLGNPSCGIAGKRGGEAESSKLSSQGSKEALIANKEVEQEPKIPWIKSPIAGILFGTVVALNAIVIGIDIEVAKRFGKDSTSANALYVVELLFLFIFIVELLARYRVEYVRGNYQLQFDTIIVAITMIDLCIVSPLSRRTDVIRLKAVSTLRILQILRILSMMRLLHLSRTLSLLLLGLVMSVKAVFSVCVLLFGVMYIGSLFCASLLGNSDNPDVRAAFGSIGDSLFTHFKIMTLETWPDTCSASMQESRWWAVYFVLYITISNLALVNLITGLIMEGVMKTSANEDWSSELHVVEAGPFVETLREIADSKGMQPEALMSCSDFKIILSDELFQQLLEAYRITPRMDPDVLFAICDIERQGAITVEALSSALLRMRGPLRDLHKNIMRQDVHRSSTLLMKNVDAAAERIHKSHCKGLHDFTEKMYAHISASESLIVAEAKRRHQAHTKLHLEHTPVATPEECLHTTSLLHKAYTSARLLGSTINKLERSLTASLDQEAALRAELARLSFSASTQTEPEGVEQSVQTLGTSRDCYQFMERASRNSSSEPPTPPHTSGALDFGVNEGSISLGSGRREPPTTPAQTVLVSSIPCSAGSTSKSTSTAVATIKCGSSPRTPRSQTMMSLPYPCQGLDKSRLGAGSFCPPPVAATASAHDIQQPRWPSEPRRPHWHQGLHKVLLRTCSADRQVSKSLPPNWCCSLHVPPVRKGMETLRRLRAATIRSHASRSPMRRSMSPARPDPFAGVVKSLPTKLSQNLGRQSARLRDGTLTRRRLSQLVKSNEASLEESSLMAETTQSFLPISE